MASLPKRHVSPLEVEEEELLGRKETPRKVARQKNSPIRVPHQGRVQKQTQRITLSPSPNSCKVGHIIVTMYLCPSSIRLPHHCHMSSYFDNNLPICHFCLCSLSPPPIQKGQTLFPSMDLITPSVGAAAASQSTSNPPPPTPPPPHPSAAAAAAAATRPEPKSTVNVKANVNVNGDHSDDSGVKRDKTEETKSRGNDDNPFSFKKFLSSAPDAVVTRPKVRSIVYIFFRLYLCCITTTPITL